MFRIRIQEAFIYADPCGSGSETLPKRRIVHLHSKVAASSEMLWLQTKRGGSVSIFIKSWLTSNDLKCYLVLLKKKSAGIPKSTSQNKSSNFRSRYIYSVEDVHKIHNRFFPVGSCICECNLVDVSVKTP